jgi:Mrp family chromosome partitioning ATPase
MMETWRAPSCRCVRSTRRYGTGWSCTFEVRGITHKPKLIAVTSTGHGAGVTTTAAGLAACLSETGDGNVLLVDMNQEQGSAQQFCQGRPVAKLEEALYKKDSAMVQDKLYVVTETEAANTAASFRAFCPSGSRSWCRSSRPAITITSFSTCRRSLRRA